MGTQYIQLSHLEDTMKCGQLLFIGFFYVNVVELRSAYDDKVSIWKELNALKDQNVQLTKLVGNLTELNNANLIEMNKNTMKNLAEISDAERRNFENFAVSVNSMLTSIKKSTTDFLSTELSVCGFKKLHQGFGKIRYDYLLPQRALRVMGQDFDYQDSSLLQPDRGMFTVPVAGSYLVTATGIVDFGWQGGNPRNAKLRLVLGKRSHGYDYRDDLDFSHISRPKRSRTMPQQDHRQRSFSELEESTMFADIAFSNLSSISKVQVSRTLTLALEKSDTLHLTQLQGRGLTRVPASVLDLTFCVALLSVDPSSSPASLSSFLPLNRFVKPKLKPFQPKTLRPTWTERPGITTTPLDNEIIEGSITERSLIIDSMLNK